MTKLLLVASAAVTVALGGCTARFSESFSDGATVETVTIANLWAPNVSVVRLPDGTYHVLGGSSSAGQIAGPAAVYASSHEIRRGLEDSGDTITNGASAGGASAAADASVDIDLDVNSKKK